jgi:hypothetical protein
VGVFWSGEKCVLVRRARGEGKGAGFRSSTCEVGGLENWESRGEGRREGKREKVEIYYYHHRSRDRELLVALRCASQNLIDVGSDQSPSRLFWVHKKRTSRCVQALPGRELNAFNPFNRFNHRGQGKCVNFKFFLFSIMLYPILHPARPRRRGSARRQLQCPPE